MPFDVAFLDRFWKRVAKGAPEACWPWTASRTRAGYGQLQARRYSSQPLTAHRVAWEVATGTAPGNLHVLHRCDNPACVNPEHLFLGTQRDNNEDRNRKQRTASGENNGAVTKPLQNPFVRDGGSGLRREAHPMAKLTEEEVATIRRSYTGGRGQLKELGLRFRISSTHVLRIVRGKNWRDS